MGSNMQHSKLTRRSLLHTTLLTGTSYVATSIFPVSLLAVTSDTTIEHPFQKPKKYTDKGRCPNCGMGLNMWARTRHEFINSEGEHAVCSIRCMADISNNSGEKPTMGKTALYLRPEKMVQVENAYYLLGSSAKGTMTMKSKIAFASEEDAKAFQQQYGGKIISFQEALKAAGEELAVSRPKIEKKRKKKGKIVAPTPETSCSVCGMYPARYPDHRSQLSDSNKEVHHFCSNQCLVNFLDAPKKYVKTPAKVKSIWVSIPGEHSYEYAMGLYYLVGSTIMGPMGKEAIPYRNKATAEAAAKKHGGKVFRFNALTPELIFGN